MLKILAANATNGTDILIIKFGTYFQLIDLVAMLNGGICVGYSNVHYGHARNMIGPGRSSVMSDGWETARRVINQRTV